MTTNSHDQSGQSGQLPHTGPAEPGDDPFETPLGESAPGEVGAGEQQMVEAPAGDPVPRWATEHYGFDDAVEPIGSGHRRRRRGRPVDVARAGCWSVRVCWASSSWAARVGSPWPLPATTAVAAVVVGATRRRTSSVATSRETAIPHVEVVGPPEGRPVRGREPRMQALQFGRSSWSARREAGPLTFVLSHRIPIEQPTQTPLTEGSQGAVRVSPTRVVTVQQGAQ
jgi:hypothetical protein